MVMVGKEQHCPLVPVEAVGTPVLTHSETTAETVRTDPADGDQTETQNISDEELSYTTHSFILTYEFSVCILD
jgi:hypothetical protein